MTPSNSNSGPTISRRTMLQRAGAGLLGAALPLGAAAAATQATPKTKSAKPATPHPEGNVAGLDELTPLNRFPRMMHDFWLPRLMANERSAEAQRAALKTRADAEAFLRDRAEKVRRCFGALPEKTPLNARITGRVERDSYTIEKVIFESRPGFLVTGSLYVPKGKTLPAPAMVGVCGHSETGKAGASQSFAQGLARLGYVCFLIDPTGQGERIQRLTPELKPVLRWNTWEHNYVGNQQLLVGEVFGLWQAWDGMRALDYLLTRPEVNPKHLMVTGASGGGTISTWMCALEPRLTGAAPVCFINTFRRMFESEQPADSEQCMPHTLALGLDHSDFFAPYAPRALRLLGQERDPFDARGLEQSFGHVEKLYRLIGAEKNVGMFMGPDGHGYFQKNREAMYRFCNELTGTATTSAEPALALETVETLRCTPQGQVGAMGSRTVMSFTAEASRALRAKRPRLEGEALRQVVAGVLQLPAREGVPDYRILPAPPGRRYPKRWAGNYAVETEPGILNIVYRLSDSALASRPPRGPKRAVLYVSDRSADVELRDEPLVRELLAAEPEAAFYASDLRGIGESQPNTTNKSFADPYGSDYFYSVYGVMFDRPYPAQRTFDVLRLVDWLKAQGHEEIHLAARGWGTIPATFAALLDERIGRVTLKHALTSYADIAEADDYNWPLSAFIFDVLKVFDLPECYAALATKGVRQIEPQGAVAV